MIDDFAAAALLMMILMAIIIAVCSGSKSKRYRRTLADLYVAAKIKTLATDDGLDLIEEYESFKRWAKSQRLNEDLDETIEAELQEKISGAPLGEKKK